MIERITDRPQPPARRDDAHKGTFGRALIIAGSRGMSGAASLAGLGALRGGAGLVYVAAPQGIAPIVAATDPSYLTIPLAEDSEGRISLMALDRLEERLGSVQAAAIGPGWGQSEELQALSRWLITKVEQPLVIDADGLNALAKMPEILSEAPIPRILTPHPGEFARLTKQSISDVNHHREEVAQQFADEHDVVLVLKGHETVITDGQKLAVNHTGNSGMATGGTGDVLTGLITALLAQGMQAFDAARLGVYLHGKAGDLAAERLSKAGLIASDLPRYLSKAWKKLEE